MIDFGGRLREARERRGKSLRQISAATKIPLATLEALERNDVTRLPAGIFSRAFVRSYAIEVGLDPDRTVAEFLSAFFGRPPESAPGAAAGPAAGSAARNAPAPAHAGAVAAAHERDAVPPSGVSEEMEFESRQRMASVVLKLVVASLPIAIAIVYLGSRAESVPAADGGGSGAEAAPAIEAEAPLPAVLPPAATAVEARVSLDDPAPSAPAPAPSVPEASPPAGPPPEDGVTIEMAPTADCWVQLTTDGAVALSRVLQAGEREARQFTASARLQVGDAGACRFYLNGREARPLGRARQVRTVTITPENFLSLVR